MAIDREVAAMKVSEFERRLARVAINRSLAQIRATGFLVSIVWDAEVLVAIDVFDGEGSCERMRIDPLNIIERLQRERAESLTAALSR